MLKRCENNPIITKDMVKPSDEMLSVEYVINPGVAKYKNETILLMRVAESVHQDDDSCIKIPVVTDGKLEIKKIPKNLPSYDYSDSRVIKMPNGSLLTTLSHLRTARSTDGIHFNIDEKPALYPTTPLESYGIEDARITKIDSEYYITYSAVSKLGVVPYLAVTDDFISYKKLGPIFHPTSKDVVLFPEKINGMYCALLRPMPAEFGSYDIWYATSPDLIHWGEYKHILSPNRNGWDCERVGASVPPIKTDKGWLVIYHGASDDGVYCGGTLLLDLHSPHKLIAKSDKPFMIPSMPYETDGFFSNTVFPTGTVENDGILRIYYGCADTCISTAVVSLDSLLD